MVDAWECSQPDWTRTALVLESLAERLARIDGRAAKVMMVRTPWLNGIISLSGVK